MRTRVDIPGRRRDANVRERATRIVRRCVHILFPRKYYARKYYECPCCGKLAESFLPHGVRQRQNARCPGCGSLERHRLHWLFLKTRTNLYSEPLKVLHFAPEPGLQRLLQSRRNLTYHSADLGSRRAAEHFDICAIPYPADTFDVVLCSHVLEHVPDDRKAMSELFRVMKPGAWGLIEAPIQHTRTATFEDWSVTSETDRVRVFGQRDHVRIYGRDYYDRLRSAGFSVEEHHYAKELPASMIEKHLLRPTGIITICTKAPGAS